MAIASIHIPDNIHQQLKLHKVNVSKVCRKALEIEVTMQKIDYNKINADRLRKSVMKQRDDSYLDDFQMGKKTAQLLAENDKLPYKEFLCASSNHVSKEMKDVLLNDAKNKVKSQDMFIYGFIAGVNEIRADLGIKL